MKQKQTTIDKLYDFLYKDVSWIKGFNSMILIALLIIFFKLFLIGYHSGVLKSYFELMVILGLIIIIFSTIPFYYEGWFMITNALLLIGGVVYWGDYSTALMSGAIKLNAVFIVGFILYYIIKYSNRSKNVHPNKQ